MTTVTLHPKKVVVFDPAILDTLDALQIPVVGVPQSSAKPDLIIAGGRAREAYNKLSGIAPTLSLDVDEQQFMPRFIHRIEPLGKIFGKQDDVKAKLDDFKQRSAQPLEKARKTGKVRVLMVNGGKISVYGPKSRFGFVFDELGFATATEFPDPGRHGNVVTAELLLSINPEWLFVLDRDSAIGTTGGLPAQQVLDNPLVTKTKAWQNQHVVYLDSASLYIADGLQSYSRLIDDANKALDKK